MSIVFHLDLNFKKSKASLTKGPANHNAGIFMEGSNGYSLFLIHGLTGTPNEMRSLAIFFNKQGYSVICPRLAYHGETLRVLKMAKWQDFYASIREAYLNNDAVKRSERVFVAGLSMGALLALLLAEEFPDKIAGVSCLAPTVYYDGWNAPWTKFLLPLGYHTPLKYFFYFKEDPPYGIKNERIRNFIHRFYTKTGITDHDPGNIAKYGYPFFPVSQLHQIRLLAKYLLKRLPRITIPVQLIQAKDDDVSHIRSSGIIYERLGSKTKEMHLLYDSYHIITADQERDKVTELMRTFYDRINGGDKK
ncbi:MAG: alpha/beta fold hydrolase [Candidatus Omnitrophica bacterium]|nr:alpha/beta fold hydrolase [Candidatus Omnitrophota bacterium]